MAKDKHKAGKSGQGHEAPYEPDGESAPPLTAAQQKANAAAYAKQQQEPVCTVNLKGQFVDASLDLRNGTAVATAPTLSRTWGAALTAKDPLEPGWKAQGDSVLPDKLGLKGNEGMYDLFARRTKEDGFTVKTGDNGQTTCDVDTKDGKSFKDVPARVIKASPDAMTP